MAHAGNFQPPYHQSDEDGGRVVCGRRLLGGSAPRAGIEQGLSQGRSHRPKRLGQVNNLAMVVDSKPAEALSVRLG